MLLAGHWSACGRSIIHKPTPAVTDAFHARPYPLAAQCLTTQRAILGRCSEDPFVLAKAVLCPPPGLQDTLPCCLCETCMPLQQLSSGATLLLRGATLCEAPSCIYVMSSRLQTRYVRNLSIGERQEFLMRNTYKMAACCVGTVSLGLQIMPTMHEHIFCTFPMSIDYYLSKLRYH